MGSREKEPFVIAVDSGGTHTRVGCFGLDGTLLSAISGRGGSPRHNKDAADNVADAVDACLQSGSLDPAGAVGLAAGIAEIQTGRSLDDETNAWAAAYFSALPRSCPRVLVNDAVTAHHGALLGRSGVIVVAGTGSMILARTRDGSHVESGWFEHYAGAARHLVFDAMQLILLGADQPADGELVAQALAYWGAADVPELREVILRLQGVERTEVMRRYGRLASTITALADSSPLADRVLRELARKTARGIHVLAPMIGDAPVPVALAGAVATHPEFQTRLADALADETGAVPTTIVPPALDPLRGAALLAYDAAAIPWTDAVLARLFAGGDPADLLGAGGRITSQPRGLS